MTTAENSQPEEPICRQCKTKHEGEYLHPMAHFDSTTGEWTTVHAHLKCDEPQRDYGTFRFKINPEDWRGWTGNPQ